jgi:replication-associated recombination protein RarA
MLLVKLKMVEGEEGGCTRMKFLDNLFHHKPTTPFSNIFGYDDIKAVVTRALEADENYNLLFIGAPASAKTLFLQDILELRKDGVYFDGSNTTNRILDVLEEERPKIICIDEAEKMSRVFQNQLLNFMESGRVKVDMQKKQYDFEIKGAKVFATANEVSRLSKPLQSRFRKLFLPRYTEEQFIEVSIKVLKNLNRELARYIGAVVFKIGGDIRDVLSIGKLVKIEDGPAEVDILIRTLLKYGENKNADNK